MSLRQSPLVDQHRALAANLVEFGGWEMPIAYPSGTIDEHMACRNGAAMFDVSHLGSVRVDGEDAFERLQATLTNDLSKIGPGRAQYTHLLSETDASVLDDIIVWWHPDVDGQPDVFDVMPNASNTDDVVSAIGGRESTSERAVIAVQGKQARDLVRPVFSDAADVGRFKVARCSWNGTECIVAGTGYTGEPGLEIAVPTGAAPALWAELIEGGIAPAGLGARDTLRLEAGLPLHGHELGTGITSLQAGLGWVVAWDKPTFHGREAARAEREAGVSRQLIGITTEGRRPARADCAIRVGGNDVGIVTSGNYSPVLGHGVAMGFVPPSVSPGDVVEIDVRGKVLPGRVAELPFI